MTVPKGIDGEKIELALAPEEGGTGSDPWREAPDDAGNIWWSRRGSPWWARWSICLLGGVKNLLNRFATAALAGLTDGGGLWGALELGCSPLYWVHSGTGSAGGVGSLSRTPRGPGGNGKCKKRLCLRRSWTHLVPIANAKKNLCLRRSWSHLVPAAGRRLPSVSTTRSWSRRSRRQNRCRAGPSLRCGALQMLDCCHRTSSCLLSSGDYLDPRTWLQSGDTLLTPLGDVSKKNQRRGNNSCCDSVEGMSREKNHATVTEKMQPAQECWRWTYSQPSFFTPQPFRIFDSQALPIFCEDRSIQLSFQYASSHISQSLQKARY